MNGARETILVVDDEVHMQLLFKRILEKEDYNVESASSGEEGLERLDNRWFDLIISDLRLPGMDGLEFIKKAKGLNPTIPCIVLTGYGTIQSAVTAMKEGAYEYLTKPIHNNEIKSVVEKVLELYRLTRAVERVRAQSDIDSDFGELIGHSKPMRTLFHAIKVVATSNSTVLIQGESGTGKELIARAIHRHSPRHDRPFVPIDCGTLPETLLESELFGHVRGAFTGAISNKRGLFEDADGGTLLLDEIADTTPAFQAKLLRVLQESEVRPVGSNRSKKIFVRVIASTNKDLKRAVESGTFREDLYYRLAVVPIMVPPLKRRREDIPLLVEFFIKKYCDQNGLELKSVSAKSLGLLMNHPWPGNVRELENVIERAVLMSPGSELNPEALSPDEMLENENSVPLHQATREVKENVEREKIREALQKAEGNRSRAARFLGISRASLYEKLKSYNLAQQN
jgi:DNA-binding NtrC family response regulator